MSSSTLLDLKTIQSLYKKLDKSIPDAKSELIYRNHFELLISVILSAQATDKTVNSVTVGLFKKYPDPQSLLQLGQSKLSQEIKSIGLAPTKAKNIIATCKILIEDHLAQVPSTREELERLPGVGRKTANVVLNEAFDKPTIAVDTHVYRVANRTGLAPGKTVVKTEENLLEVTPRRWLKQAHRLLILHGRYVCKAKNFQCGPCAIEKECQFEDKHFENQ